MTRSTILLGAAIFLTSCSGKKPPPPGAELQSDAGAALLQTVIDQCPRVKDVRCWNLTVGEHMGAPDEGFRKRLKLPDIPYVPSNSIQVAVIKGRRTIFDSETGASPLTLQISSLTLPKDGRQEGVAAWAWMDEAHRARYEMLARPGGGWDIRLIEEIPVAPVNTSEPPK